MLKIAFILVTGVLSLSCFGAAKEKPPPPQPLTYTIPAAAAPGKTTRVVFHGAVSGKGVGAWTNFGGGSGRAEGDGAFDLRVPETTPVGIYAVRLMTAAGVSNLQLFMVDDLATVMKGGKNNSAEGAQGISLPVAVDGACEGLASDYYALDAKAGEQITFDVVAQRLGSKLDPMLRVLDAGGREVAYCDDTPGLGGDIRFAHTFAAAGQYVVELRDGEYEGGSEFRYRLRIGGFPAATVVFPVGAKRGTKAALEPAEIGEVYKPFKVQVGDGVRQNIGLKMNASDSGSGFVSILTGESADIVGGDENHTLKSAMKIKTPAAISGRFLTAGVRDFYAIDARKGERYFIRARTRSVHSPCDLYLQFLKPDGSKLAESKAVAADEGEMDVLIPADGAYRLGVEDMGRGAGAAYVYRVEIGRVLPGFSLSAESDRLNGVSGGVVKLKVKCVRRDFDGPVTLSLAGEAKGFEVKNAVIEKGKTETELEIKIPEGEGAGVIGLRMNGAAMVGGALRVEKVGTIGVLKNVFPRLAYVPVELDGEIGLGVRGK